MRVRLRLVSVRLGKCIKVNIGHNTMPTPIQLLFLSYVHSDCISTPNRKYELQFLLLGLITAEIKHMVLCVKQEGGRWMLYDNSGTPQFQDFNMEMEMKKYVPYLAAYVNLNSAYPEEQVQESEQGKV